MNTEIAEIDEVGLRKFAFSIAAVLVTVFGAVLPFLFHRPVSYWPWIVALVLILWGWILPLRLRWIYHHWMKLALIVGKINSTVLLSVIFVCIVSPLGILLRLFGYDPLNLKWQSSTPSYRRHSDITLKNHLEKPY